MKKTSLLLRFFFYYLLITVILNIFYLLVILHLVRHFHNQYLARNLSDFNRALGPSVERYLTQHDYQGLDTFVKSLHSRTGPRITVILPEGRVVADSDTPVASLDNHSTRPEVVEAMSGRTGQSLRYSTTTGEYLLYVATPLTKNGNILAVIRTSKYLREINRTRQTFISYLLPGLLLSTAVALLLTFFLGRRFTKPFLTIKQSFARLASGDFQVRIAYPDRDEIGELADHFNEMADQIRRLFTELTHQKEKMDALVHSLPDGLCVCDPTQRITMHNNAWSRIVGQESTIGRYPWELLRQSAFKEMLDKSLEQRKPSVKELFLQGHDYYCSITPVQETEEIVIILRDITPVKEFDRKKKDFVTNVSHELRTPLTAIKGYLETIEPASEENRYYLQIIKRNTERLIAIVNDLVTLSQLEEPGQQILHEQVDLYTLVNDTVKLFEEKIKRKNLSLRIEAEPSVFIEGDYLKLEQMLINLIDNAIKYTETGGIVVQVKKFNENVKIVVQDTGIGIPAEHLGRIFERFYVVDKARSRLTGGTGLGLSIVKHIVLAHKGDITVESLPGKGTEFVVTLPVSLTER